ncbi:MAG: hypothetical protein WCO60_13960, partial [Verrucomicrobiota bacterium]
TKHQAPSTKHQAPSTKHHASCPIMKAFILAAVLIPSVLLAEVPVPRPPAQEPTHVSARTPQSPVRRDNYLLTVFTTDKDGDLPEVCVVLAAPYGEVAQFNVTLGGPGDKIQGLLRIWDAGALTLDYTLGWETRIPNGNMSNTARICESSTKSSVCLNLGEEVQILRVGTRTTRVSIKKLEAATTK